MRKYTIEITPREAAFLQSGLNHLCRYLEGVCQYVKTEGDWERVKFIEANIKELQELGQRLLKETDAEIVIIPPVEKPDTSKN